MPDMGQEPTSHLLEMKEAANQGGLLALYLVSCRCGGLALIGTRSWESINSEGAEFRVLFADFPELNVLRVGPPRLDFLHAVPDLHDGALRRCAIKRSHGLRAGPAGSTYC
jgi:hypothetical protein